jgi:hypothetical protein
MRTSGPVRRYRTGPAFWYTGRMNSSTESARFRRRIIASLLLCTLAFTGCYRNLEIATPVPVEGTRIAARLSPVAAEQMAAVIGDDAVAVEGFVRRWDDAEVELALIRIDHNGARSVDWSGERIVFPANALRNVRERRLDTVRTAGFVAGVAALATVLAVAFVRFVGGGGDGDGGPIVPPE